MSTSRTFVKQDQEIALPSTMARHPLTLPPTGERQFPQVPRVLALFKQKEAGQHSKREPWTDFQVVGGYYDEIERRLKQDTASSGFVKDEIW